MPTHLPIPHAYCPRSEPDLATVNERLGGQVALHVGGLVEKTVMVDGAPTKRKVASFSEWWLEYPAEIFPPGATEPPAPEDSRLRDLLVGVARIAAHGWAKEVKLAKGWPPEPPPIPASGAAPVPFTMPGTRKGAK